MYDIMVINNGSSTTNSPFLQMDHLNCCEPPVNRASHFIRVVLGGALGVQCFPHL